MKVYNILIVEDDLIIGELLQKILQREKYNVCWEKEGRKVLDVIHEIDLVIMDVMMLCYQAKMVIKLQRK